MADVSTHLSWIGIFGYGSKVTLTDTNIRANPEITLIVLIEFPFFLYFQVSITDKIHGTVFVSGDVVRSIL